MKKKNLLSMIMDSCQSLFSILTFFIGTYILSVNKILSIEIVFYGVIIIALLLFIGGISNLKKDYVLYKDQALI